LPSDVAIETLSFWVNARPVPKERARTIKTKRGKYRTFTPDRTATWESLVRLTAQAACSAAKWKPKPGRYTVEVTVHRARRAGDADNFLKAAKDAMNGVVWPDDRMVVSASVRLVDGEGVGMRVLVTMELDVAPRSRKAPKKAAGGR